MLPSISSLIFDPLKAAIMPSTMCTSPKLNGKERAMAELMMVKTCEVLSTAMAKESSDSVDA